MKRANKMIIFIEADESLIDAHSVIDEITQLGHTLCVAGDVTVTVNAH